MSEMVMDLFKPPGVACWKAYYQYPVLSKQWINASSQIKRGQFLKNFFFDGIEAADTRLKADINLFLNQFKSRTIKQVIDTTIYYFHPIYDAGLANDILNQLYEVCDEISWNNSLTINEYTHTQEESIRLALFSIISEPQTNLI
jgi:hypothetical protein